MRHKQCMNPFVLLSVFGIYSICCICCVVNKKSCMWFVILLVRQLLISLGQLLPHPQEKREHFLQVLYKDLLKEQTIVNTLIPKLSHCLVCIPLLPVDDKLARGIDRSCLVCPYLLVCFGVVKIWDWAEEQPAVDFKLFEINNWGRSPLCQAQADIFQHLSHVWALSPTADLIHSMSTHTVLRTWSA